MTDEEAIKRFYIVINSTKNKTINSHIVKNRDIELYNYSMSRYNDTLKSDTIYTILYRLENNIDVRPKCINCGKPVKWRQHKFQIVCCKKCLNSKIAVEYLNALRRNTCLKKYGCSTVFENSIFREHYKQTCLEKYGTEHPFQNESIKERYRHTCLEKYGVDSSNKAECVKSKLKYKANSKETRDKSYHTKKLNHTFNSSSIEEHFKNYLESKNISYKTQYKSEKYPFCCDFYLDDLDLYIEIQGNWTHGNEPYNESNPSHQEILESWKSKSETHKYYKNAIQTWTIRDVHKRTTAKKNQLRYLEIFSCKIDEVIKVFEDFLKSNSQKQS